MNQRQLGSSMLLFNRRQRSILLVIVMAAAVAAGLAGCSTTHPSASTSSTESTSSTASTTAPSIPSVTTTTSGPELTLPDGTYVNGPQGQPYTKITWTNSSGGSVAGQVEFVFQDGRTAHEFDFSGTARGGHATLATTGGGPGTITAEYTASTLDLSGCNNYLMDTPSADMCVFRTS